MRPLHALCLLIALLIMGLTLACGNHSSPDAELLLARADSAFVQGGSPLCQISGGFRALSC